jgi:hypothetical protein
VQGGQHTGLAVNFQEIHMPALFLKRASKAVVIEKIGGSLE